MKDIIEQACYSFICQHMALCSNLPELKNSPFDKDILQYTVGSIINSIKYGINIFTDNPEKIAIRDIENRRVKKSGKSGIDIQFPPSYPFDSLCLWFTPMVYIPETKENIKEYHFIHTQKLNTNAFNLTYVKCHKLKKISENVNLEWDILPISVMITLEDTIKRTPLLPLPEINDIYNYRLRQKIIDIKSGKENDTSICFYDLLHEIITEDEKKYYTHNYLFPGIFQFLFGFLEKLNTKILKQTREFTEPIVIDDNGYHNIVHINRHLFP